MAPPSEAQTVNRIACTQAALTQAISQASSQGGGTIVFNCTDTTIPISVKIGTFQNNVILDGENRNITLEYTTNFSGCTTGDNGIGPETADMNGSGSVIRNLQFRNFLESVQIQGPNNTVEGNTFIAHDCSDDAISTNQTQALNTTIRNNTLQGYKDKAIQMSYGSGLVEGNTFIDSAQPIRSPYDNTAGGVFVIRGNTMRTSGNINNCNGVHIDGTYRLVFENNTHTCLRGVRLGGSTQVLFRNNTITGNPRGGLLLRQNARASISGNTFTNNGTSAGTEPAGGVIVWETAVADLGGGSLSINGQTVSSTGSNTLRGNGVADLRNLNTGITVKAERNCWDHQTASEIASSDTAGGVDVDPFSTSCSAGGGGVTAPNAPTNLRIVP
jgi:parallel beta-helix repeat protein